MSYVAFRCDGDDRTGAGHVSRSLRIAEAFQAGGGEAIMVGRHSGLAAALVDSSRVASREPGAAPAGIPEDAAAAVVDSYELSRGEVERAAAVRPLAVVSDGGPSPRGATVLSYHLDAEGDIAGVDYAPVDPRCAAARRPRDLSRVLVTLGGGATPAGLLRRVVAAASELGEVDLLSAKEGRAAGPGDMAARIERADAAVTGAGVTPYELACAGVPSTILAVADNQARVARAFGDAKLAVGLDARSEADDADLARAIGALGDAEVRARLAASGPRAVDGYGAFRARDALLAAFAGRPLPRVLRYRPACLEDGELLLGWRNDPAVRTASRSQDPIQPDEHRRWLARTLGDTSRVLLIVDFGGVPVGTLRFDLSDHEAEVNITVAASSRGRGIGRQAIREACELLFASRPQIARVLAEVRLGNSPSLALFEGAGFGPAAEVRTEGFALLTLARSAGLPGG